MVSINQGLKAFDQEEVEERNGNDNDVMVNDEELDGEEKNVLLSSKILQIVESKLQNERSQREEALSWCQMTLQRERTERLRERHDLLEEREDMKSRLQELENLLITKDEKIPPRRTATQDTEESSSDRFVHDLGKKIEVQISVSDESSFPQMNARQDTEVYSADRFVYDLGKRVEAQLSNRARDGSILIGSKTLSRDTYSLMMLSEEIFDRGWLLGFTVFLSQLFLCGLTVFSQLSFTGNKFSSNTPFHLPTHAKLQVIVLQLLTIIIAVYIQDDMFSAIALPIDFRLNGPYPWGGLPIKDEDRQSKYAWTKKILIPNSMKCIAGMFVLLTTVMVILQSEEVIDLLMNFTALFVISSIDNVMYSVVRHGFFGRKIQYEAKIAEDIDITSGNIDATLTEVKFCCLGSHFIKSFVLNFFLFICVSIWAFVLYKQESGWMTKQKYPACVEEVPSFDQFWTMLQNEECDMLFNNIQCGYDGGDCEDFNAIYPDCKVEYASRIADGLCDGYPYNSVECRLDGGDCRPDAIYCDSSKIGTIGNGICDEDLNTHECLYDKGDCIETNELCDIKNDDGMSVIVPGDDICGVPHEVMEFSSHQESMFNYTQSGLYAGRDECDYDGGDCLHPRYPGCYFDDRFPLFLSEIGDGICQNYSPYNTEKCAWDGGDCLAFNAKYPECKGKNPEKIGDGHCDKDYDTIQCGYDEGDCGVPKYPECRVSDPSELGNGRCNFYGNYNTLKCGYDDGDCKEYNEAPDSSRVIFYCLNLAEYSYHDHELLAQDYNGHLLSFHYLYEHRAIENILFIFQQTSNPELWISGNYENGTWIHEDGSLFDYFHWGPNQPSDYKAHKCITLTKTNWTDIEVTWRNALCTEEKGAVYKVTDLRAPGSDSTSIHCVRDSDIFGYGGT